MIVGTPCYTDTVTDRDLSSADKSHEELVFTNRTWLQMTEMSGYSIKGIPNPLVVVTTENCETSMTVVEITIISMTTWAISVFVYPLWLSRRFDVYRIAVEPISSSFRCSDQEIQKCSRQLVNLLL